MAHKIWHVNGHVVELEHGWWSGVAKVTVDGELVFTRPSPPFFVDSGFAHRFEIDGLPCAVRVVSQVYNFRHDFLTGEEAKGIEEANRVQIELPLDQLIIALSGLVIATGTAIICVVRVLGR